MVRAHWYDVEPLHQFAKPAAEMVTLGGGAVLLGNGETDPDRAVVVARAALHHEGSAVGSRAIGNGEEVRPLPQPIHNEFLREARLRRSDACGHAHGARRDPCGRRSWRDGRGSRDGACAPVCWVDRSASRVVSPLTGQFACWIEIKSGDAGRPENGPFTAQTSRPRWNRAIADSWRGLYGSDLFSSMSGVAAAAVL